MKRFVFPDDQDCPLCKGRFREAEKRAEYEPVVVVVCPHCGKLLWRPGLDDAGGAIYPFDPDADAGGI